MRTMGIEFLARASDKWVIAWNPSFFAISVHLFLGETELYYTFSFREWKLFVLQMEAQKNQYNRKPDQIFLGVSSRKCAYGPVSKEVELTETDPNGEVTSGRKKLECTPIERKNASKAVVWIELSEVKLYMKFDTFVEFRDAIISAGEKLESIIKKWRE